MSNLRDSRVWNYIAVNAENDIQAGGWYSSFGGTPFSTEEMRQYIDNTIEKLRDYLSKDKVALEIGCASGITMFAIAPFVGRYIGSDMAIESIKRDGRSIAEEKIDNIDLVHCAADRIKEVIDYKVDIVIINSVCQYFPDLIYFKDVILQCLSLLNPNGIIFIGDVLNFDLKEKFITELKEFKRLNPDISGVKEDRSDELWICKSFFYGLRKSFKLIKNVSVSNKTGSILNEMIKYRYDVIIQI